MNIKRCEYCKKEIIARKVSKRFCSPICQRKDYNRRPEIKEKYRLRIKEYRKKTSRMERETWD